MAIFKLYKSEESLLGDYIFTLESDSMETAKKLYPDYFPRLFSEGGNRAPDFKDF